MPGVDADRLAVAEVLELEHLPDSSYSPIVRHVDLVASC